jgi:hypothetical protein
MASRALNEGGKEKDTITKSGTEVGTPDASTQFSYQGKEQGVVSFRFIDNI